MFNLIKNLSIKLFVFLSKQIISLRYTVEVNIDERIYDKEFCKDGVIFMANHAAKMDPVIIELLLWNKFQPHPMAVSHEFYLPVLSKLMKLTSAIMVPDFRRGSNSFKIKKLQEGFSKASKFLQNGESVLIYPAGRLKGGALEKIGAAFGSYDLFKENPNAKICLVRIEGLWGSSFSKFGQKESPNTVSALLNGLKVLLKNFIFFAPKRKVTVTIEYHDIKRTRFSSAVVFNKYLEDFFNINGPEPVNLVKYSLFDKQPTIPVNNVDIVSKVVGVPKEIQEAIIQELADLAQMEASAITLESDLISDLSLDSISIASFAAFLKEQYKLDISPVDLVTVGDILLFINNSPKNQQLKLFENKEEPITDRHTLGLESCKSVAEAFIRKAKKGLNKFCCKDLTSGKCTYKKVLIGSLVLRDYFVKTFKEKELAIMLPASVGANMIILATLLAKKVPVMLNWTVGSKVLQDKQKAVNFKTVITSYNFLNNLNGINFGDIEDNFQLIEEVKLNLSKISKLKNVLLSLCPTNFILKLLKLNDIKEDDIAGILFTSGSEGGPKGVPLTNRNILANIKGIFDTNIVSQKDVCLGFLPPFHAFGFTITGLFPILVGLPVEYYPNPTEAAVVAAYIWSRNITLICYTPSLLKVLLTESTKEQLSSLRLVLSGAEKLSDSLAKKIQDKCDQAMVLEGYGTTECSPVISVGRSREQLGTVGNVLNNVDVLILNQDTGQKCKTNESGIIYVKGDSVFNGYLNTDSSYSFKIINNDKWYDTGDIGYFDQNNCLRLSGRLRRFIKVQGEMVNLSYMELLFIEFLENTSTDENQKIEIAVVGKELEDGNGEIHVLTNRSLTAASFNVVLRQNSISNIAKVKQVHLIEELPLLGSGKIDYKEIEKRVFN